MTALHSLEADALHAEMTAIGVAARDAAARLAITPRDAKDAALRAAATEIRAAADELLAANAEDMAAARDTGLSAALLDRLALTPERIEAMAASLEDIAELDDPVGAVIGAWTRPNGLAIERVRTPLGVIGVIYESRPNVTADAGALCLKAGHAAILRAGWPPPACLWAPSSWCRRATAPRSARCCAWPTSSTSSCRAAAAA